MVAVNQGQFVFAQLLFHLEFHERSPWHRSVTHLEQPRGERSAANAGDVERTGMVVDRRQLPGQPAQNQHIKPRCPAQEVARIAGVAEVYVRCQQEAVDFELRHQVFELIELEMSLRDAHQLDNEVVDPEPVG